mgnify:CR=1 FL=1
MAEYKGKEVKLDDPFRLPQGSDKKFGVYVKNPKSGNVIMVKFGDPNLSIKRDDPDRLKNFRARHNCDQKTDKTTPGYWSCKFWEKDSPVSKLLKQGKVSESDLKFKGKEMKDHLDKAKAKLKAEYGSLDNVDYKKAMKVVGATLAARLSARGMIKRSDGSTKKGKLGKPEEEMLNCGCGCEDCKSLEKSIYEETRKFIKGWVNPRTKKIIAWNTTSPFHSSHILENLSKYGLTMNDLIDHYIDVVLKRNPKYEPSREESLKRFKQLERNERLADRDETIEYPAIKQGWVAFTLEDSVYGKVMALRGITKDIKKSGIMLLEKFKNFKELDTIYISNYKDTKFAEYTGKTKNVDERYSSNSEAMKFLFGRRPKRREPKTEIGRTMAMFREDQELDEANIPGYKGWVNPKTGKTQIIQGHSPYHVMMIVNNPRFYGLTEKLILNHLIETYKERDSPIPEEDAEFAMQRLKSGERDIDYGVELMAMDRGWVRFVEGEYAEISGRKRFNDNELRKILQLIDKETPLTMKSKTTMGLQQYRPVGKTDVKVELYGDLEMNEIKNLIKGRKKGDKQTEIGRTMSMFREAVKTRIDNDLEVSVVQDKNGNPNIFKDLETARKKAESINGKVIKGTRGEIMVQVLVDPSLRKHLEEDDQWKDKNDEREHNKLFMKSMRTMPGSPKQKKIIQQMNALRKKNGLELLGEEKRVPKTRKNQDPDTHSDLYTDEDPRGTIHGLGFKDVETAEASVRKIKASDRTHAHKIQAAIAMEQRAKVMKKTAEAAVYRKYIEEMKKKTKEMNEEAYLPGQATTSHGGKSGRGGKPGPRMNRQRRHREEVLMHLITNGIKVTNQPSMVTQKGSSDTFAVAKNQVKKAEKMLDDFFKKAYIKKSGMRRDAYTIIAEDVNEVYKDSGLGDWFGKGGGGGKEKGGWDRYNASGERIGKCGDAPEGAAYSACLSAEKADQLGKEGRAKFVQRKRDAQKKSGDKAKGGESKKGQKPVMVSTGAKGLDKKNESFMSFGKFISEGENKPNNPALWKKAIAKAKAKFDVYPSAYANAWASKWYKGEGGTWSKK